MRELLEASSQRIIKILETLSIRDGWTTFADLAKAVRASERTVAEDVAKTKKRWDQKLNLEVSRKNGVRLHNQNTASIGLVFTELFNESVSLHWIKELFFHPNQGMEFYENKLFVSRSTLLRQLPKINRAFASKGMAIQAKNNRFQLLGKDEQYLRDFCTGFLLEMYGLDLKKYDLELDLTVVMEFISSVLLKNVKPEEFNWLLQDDVSVIYQVMLYLVSLVREEQGYALVCSYPVENEADEKWLGYLRKYFPHLQMDNLRPIHRCLYRQYNGWDSDEELTLVTRETDCFFQRVLEAIPVSPDQDTLRMLYFMIKSLYLSAKIRSSKTSVLFDRIYYFSLSLKKSNLFLYETVSQSLKLFSQNVKLDMSARLSDVLFWVCLTCPELCQSTHARKALLIDDFGRPHARFLTKLISDFFNGKDFLTLQIDAVSSLNIPASAEIDRYDVLITTISNLPVYHRHTVLINDYPNNWDFCKIHRALNQKGSG